jgi:hypothetical protein
MPVSSATVLGLAVLTMKFNEKRSDCAFAAIAE